MQTKRDDQLMDKIQFPGLPLTIYREIETHLRQVEGVETGLEPASEQFDYNQSQVGALWIQYSQTAGEASRERVAQILAYYQNRYGANQVENSQAE